VIFSKKAACQNRVAGSVDVVKERKGATALLSEPLSLIDERVGSTAVLSVPVVLSNNAAAPTAVLEIRGVRTSVPSTNTGVKLFVEVAKSEYQPTPVFPAPS